MISSEWLYGLMGGLMIGVAAAIFLLVNGRIMGASGIVGGLIDGSGRNDRTESLAFLAGLIGLPALWVASGGQIETHQDTAWPLLILAGLSVGFGTRLASGCTSGHGVCGISRFSPRGIVATLVYLGMGMATMLVFRHLLGLI